MTLPGSIGDLLEECVECISTLQNPPNCLCVEGIKEFFSVRKGRYECLPFKENRNQSRRGEIKRAQIFKYFLTPVFHRQVLCTLVNY